MVLAQGDVANFADLANETLATPVNETSAASRAIEIAESINVRIDILQPQPREQDLAFVMLENEDAEAAFGDSLRLIPHVQAYPTGLRLTTEEDRGDNSDRWYSREYVAMAVPRNDIDFRLLVDYTLQELVRDGTLRDLLQPLMMPEDIPDFLIWPGSSQYLGYNLGS
jgi:ABC-type amino acid transport substrate-binding protein